MMDAKRLEEIRARAERATAGPWHLVDRNQIHDRETKFNEYGVRLGETPNLIAVEKWPNGSENAKFIANARQDIPDLLVYIGELQGATRALIADIKRTNPLASVHNPKLKCLEKLIGESGGEK